MVAVLSEVGQCVKTRMEKKPNNYLFLTLGFGWGGGELGCTIMPRQAVGRVTDGRAS